MYVKCGIRSLDECSTIGRCVNQGNVIYLQQTLTACVYFGYSRVKSKIQCRCCTWNPIAPYPICPANRPSESDTFLSWGRCRVVRQSDLSRNQASLPCRDHQRAATLVVEPLQGVGHGCRIIGCAVTQSTIGCEVNPRAAGLEVDVAGEDAAAR